MPRINLTDIHSLPDIIPTCYFLLQFGVIPIRGANRNLSVKCQTVALPGFNNESYGVRLHGLPPVHFRGPKNYGNGEMTIQFVEDATMDTLKSLRMWHEAVVGSESGSSIGSKAQYAITSTLSIYSSSSLDDEIDRIKIINMFPKDVQEINLTGEQAAAMTVQASFQFDEYRDESLSIR